MKICKCALIESLLKWSVPVLDRAANLVFLTWCDCKQMHIFDCHFSISEFFKWDVAPDVEWAVPQFSHLISNLLEEE